MANDPVKISVRGFAEVASAPSQSKQRTLKKYRYPTSDASVGRSNYYVKALSAIRRHHRGDSTYVNNLLQELLAEMASEKDTRKKAKLGNNHRAITEYLKHFGHRSFTIRPGKHLYFVYKQLIVSAQPDLVAEENGSLLLIKLNFTKDDYAGGLPATMLHMLYEAAQLCNLPVLSSGVECLQVSSGSRIKGPKSGFPPKKGLEKACQELLDLWPAA
jgi:hypothetical protein